MGAGWLLEMGMDNRSPPQRLSGWFLGFMNMGSKNSKDQFEYINHGPQKNQKIKK
jgi:hypothetical protein